MKRIVIKKKLLLNNVAFCIYSVLLVSIILSVDWFSYSSISEDSDIVRYIYNIDGGVYDKTLWNDGILNTLTSEYLWAKVVSVLNIVASSELIILIIIPSICIFFYSIFIYKKSKPIYIFLLLHPLLLLFYLNQLRLAFAFALYYIFSILYRGKKLYFLSSLLILIHMSIILFLSIFFATKKITEWNTSVYKRIFYLLCLGLLTSVVTGPLVANIFLLIGDKARAEGYSTDQWQTSLMTSLYCIIFIAIIISNFLLQKRKKIDFYIGTSIVFFTTVAVSPVFTGGYPLRLLTAVLPIVIISFYRLDDVFKYMSLFLFIIVGLYIGLIQLNWIHLIKFIA